MRNNQLAQVKNTNSAEIRNSFRNMEQTGCGKTCDTGFTLTMEFG